VKRKAAIALMLLSPVVAELLSGSAPPREFFNPLIFLLLISLYGTSALLLRELKLYMNGGYTCLLFLGMMYGVLEEGIAVKSFFDPSWPDLGPYGLYGRWHGVNWIWLVNLTVYHSVWSIVIPVSIVESIFPSISEERWLSRRGYLVLLSILTTDLIVINRFVTKYQPEAFGYILSFALMSIFLYLSKICAKRRERERIASPRKLLIYSFTWSMLFFILFFTMPLFMPYPVISLGISILMGYLIFLLVSYLDSSLTSKEHKLYFSMGPIASLAILAILQGLQPGKIDMLPVGIVCLILIFLALRKIEKH